MLKTKKLIYPLGWYDKKKREHPALGFGQQGIYRGVDWGIHLGEDILCPENSPVRAIADGRVVYSNFHPGDKQKGNWGHIIIIEHQSKDKKKVFYSLYGHLGKLYKKVGKKVKQKQIIGRIGKSYTAGNGWWISHLHFSIYVGPWDGVVLPGYYKKGQNRTKLKYWKDPGEFIERNNF